MNELLGRKCSDSRIATIVEKHPYIALLGLSLLVAGGAAGISTSLVVGDKGALSYLFSGVASGGSINSLAAVARIMLVNYALMSLITAAVYYRAFYPLCCVSIITKGFVWGIAFGAFLAEYDALGALYGVVSLAVPAAVTVTGFFLSFVSATANLIGTQKSAEEATADRVRRVAYCCVLVVLGSAAEGFSQTLFAMLFHK